MFPEKLKTCLRWQNSTKIDDRLIEWGGQITSPQNKTAKFSRIKKQFLNFFSQVLFFSSYIYI